MPPSVYRVPCQIMNPNFFPLDSVLNIKNTTNKSHLSNTKQVFFFLDFFFFFFFFWFFVSQIRVLGIVVEQKSSF
jgi:hypothetical protein